MKIKPFKGLDVEKEFFRQEKNFLLDFEDFESIVRSSSFFTNIDESELAQNLNEAKFGYSLIAPLLEPEPMSILEVGSGSGLLSLYLALLGHRVVGLEPIGDGFEHFSQLLSSSLNFADSRALVLEFRQEYVENVSTSELFDFSFSINTLEHVENWRGAIVSMLNMTKPTGATFIVTPNYGFPYEAHFEIPIVYNKEVTFKLFQRLILSRKFPDPKGLWKSLNWISYSDCRPFLDELKMCYMFYPSIKLVLDRVRADRHFRRRRGKVFGLIVFVISFLFGCSLLDRLTLRVHPLIVLYIRAFSLCKPSISK